MGHLASDRGQGSHRVSAATNAHLSSEGRNSAYYGQSCRGRGRHVARRFSQFPIYHHDRTFVEVLTTETIVRWTSQNPGKPWEETAVLDVLSYTEDPDHFAFLSTESSVVEAVELFDEFARRGKYVDALLLTKLGSRDRIPEGIITQYDLPVLYQMLSTPSPMDGKGE